MIKSTCNRCGLINEFSRKEDQAKCSVCDRYICPWCDDVYDGQLNTLCNECNDYEEHIEEHWDE